jgi:hypothetical protein
MESHTALQKRFHGAPIQRGAFLFCTRIFKELAPVALIAERAARSYNVGINRKDISPSSLGG